MCASYKSAQTIFVLFGADPYQCGLPSVALRAVETEDFMTVSPLRPPLSELEEMGKTFLQHYPVGAFVYDITEKPPATTEWE